MLKSKDYGRFAFRQVCFRDGDHASVNVPGCLPGPQPVIYGRAVFAYWPWIIVAVQNAEARKWNEDTLSEF